MSQEADGHVHTADGSPRGAGGAGPLRAELTVEHPRVVLGPTMSRLPDATVQSSGRLDDLQAAPTFFQIGGVDPTRIERALSTDPTVSDCRCVAIGESTHTYRLRVTANAIALSPPAAERGIQVRSATRQGVGWHLQLSAPDREAISDYRQYCLDRGIDVSIDRLCEVEEWSGGRVALSERHRVTLQAALDAGYFEIPRTATQDDLAERLDVSGSAVSQRLRRATRELIVRSLGSADDERGVPDHLH